MSDAAFAQSLARYRAACAQGPADDLDVGRQRFVVLDCETTGLDAARHRIVSIGAVAVMDGQIVLGDRFEAILRVRFNTAATLVHGITRDQTRDALDEAEAMACLLDYVADGVIVGHHISHDLAMIDAALARHGDARLSNAHVDTGTLLRLLDADGAFGDLPDQHAPLSLDALCARFGIVPHDRHTAPGDAFLTAEVFLRLLRAARRVGRSSLAGLTEQPDSDAAGRR